MAAFASAELPLPRGERALTAGFADDCTHDSAVTEKTAWGYDGYGQCSRQPALAAGETFSSISAGGSHSLALTSTVLKVPHDDGNVKVPAEVAYGECPWMEVRSRLHVS